MSEVANRVLKNSGYLYFSMGLSILISLLNLQTFPEFGFSPFMDHFRNPGQLLCIFR